MSDTEEFTWSYSHTSTQAKQSTPFAEFAWSVQQLCKKLWPTSFEEVSIERLQGGSYNRIIGLTIKSSLATSSDQQDIERPSLMVADSNIATQDRSSEYILRISRDAESLVDGDIITLCYVRARSSIPVPQIVAFDLGTDNLLGSPYTIQHRIAGVPLIQVMDDLTQTQRRQLVVQIAGIVRELQGMTSPVPGQLGFPNSSLSQNMCTKQHVAEDREHPKSRQLVLQEKLSRMIEYEGGSRDGSGLVGEPEFDFISEKNDPKLLHYTNVSPGDSFNGTINNHMAEGATLGCIQLQITRNLIDALKIHTGAYVTRCYARLLEVTHEMNELGYFSDIHFNLFHHDLEPRNIMVQIDDQSGDLKVTGILDWDQVKFVPRFVSCCPLPWLWCYDDDPYFDEATAYEAPEDPEMEDLKRLFNELVGEEFVKLAYSPQYRLARRLFKYAVEGIFGCWDVEAIDELVSEWSDFRNGLQEADGESEDQGIADTEEDEGDGDSDVEEEED